MSRQRCGAAMGASFHRATPHANTERVALATSGSGRFPPALKTTLRPMNLRRAISMKLVSVLLFAVMSALVRHVGETVPLGQVVFFRSAFAIIPVMVIYAWRGELGAALRTGRPLGHVTRGLIAVVSMFLNFAALARLPLVDATAISFAAPFITVALAALVLKEPVRAYRWSAVVVGFCCVLVMLGPYLDSGALVAAGSPAHTIGAPCPPTAPFSNPRPTPPTAPLPNIKPPAP